MRSSSIDSKDQIRQSIVRSIDIASILLRFNELSFIFDEIVHDNPYLNWEYQYYDLKRYTQTEWLDLFVSDP